MKEAGANEQKQDFVPFGEVGAASFLMRGLKEGMGAK